MSALVTLEVAKAHLRVPDEDTARDNDIMLKVDQASGLVLDWCGSTAYWRAITATWTDVTVPVAVQAAVLLVLTHLNENRGDDMKVDADLWDAVGRLIAFYKDPVIA